jgi:hypothetical protein
MITKLISHSLFLEFRIDTYSILSRLYAIPASLAKALITLVPSQVGTTNEFNNQPDSKHANIYIWSKHFQYIAVLSLHFTLPFDSHRGTRAVAQTCDSISSHSTTIMGEAPPSHEHVLCLLPFPNNQSVLDSIKEKHPNVEIVYKQILFKKGSFQVIPESIPLGMNLFHTRLRHICNIKERANICIL